MLKNVVFGGYTLLLIAPLAASTWEISKLQKELLAAKSAAETAAVSEEYERRALLRLSDDQEQLENYFWDKCVNVSAVRKMSFIRKGD